MPRPATSDEKGSVGYNALLASHLNMNRVRARIEIRLRIVQPNRTEAPKRLREDFDPSQFWPAPRHKSNNDVFFVIITSHSTAHNCLKARWAVGGRHIGSYMIGNADFKHMAMKPERRVRSVRFGVPRRFVGAVARHRLRLNDVDCVRYARYITQDVFKVGSSLQEHWPLALSFLSKSNRRTVSNLQIQLMVKIAIHSLVVQKEQNRIVMENSTIQEGKLEK